MFSKNISENDFAVHVEIKGKISPILQLGRELICFLVTA